MGSAIVCPRGLTGHLPAGHLTDRSRHRSPVWPWSSRHAPPNPIRIFQTLLGFQQSAALRAAIGLDLFTAVGEGPHRRRRHREADWRLREGHARAVRRAGDHELPDSKTGSTYGLVPESAVFLNKREPSYIGSVANFLVDDIQASGRLQGCHGGGEKGRLSVQRGRHGLARQPDLGELRAVDGAADGDAVASCSPARLTSETAGPIEVLDIAAGHGLYGIAFATAESTGEDHRGGLEERAAGGDGERGGRRRGNRHRTTSRQRLRGRLRRHLRRRPADQLPAPLRRADVRRPAEAAACGDAPRRTRGRAGVRAERRSRRRRPTTRCSR